MKEKRLYIALFALSIIFLGIGGTFAYLTVSVNATNITQIKSGNLTMTIDGGGNENVTLFPAKCTSEYAIKKTIKASAKNTSGGKVSFSVGMNVATLGADLKRNTMKYALTTVANSCTDGLIASGNFSEATVGSDIWMIKNDYDDITNSGNTYNKTYYLYIWLDQSETQNLSGSISVNMKGTSSNNPNLTTEASIDETGTLYYEIKSHADTTTQIDFNQSSTPIQGVANTKNDNPVFYQQGYIGNGANIKRLMTDSSGATGDEDTGKYIIYTTTNTESGKPVYYYRGDVDNHVIFANFCWRIIRTTETKGVKLIYDGVPYNGTCDNTGSDTTIGDSAFNGNYNSPAYVGYMYGTVYTPNQQDLSALSGSIVFGNDITYANGTYTLKDTYTLTDVGNWSTEQETIASKYHYTCFTSSNTCQKVNYIYFNEASNSGSKSSSASIGLLYFELSGGKNHLDILKEMLNNSSNTTNSAAKTAVDAWYQANMTNYTSQLEDTVFCNDRSYAVSGTGWDKDATNIVDDNGTNLLIFNAARRLLSIFTTNTTPTLVCQNANDKFTVSSNKGNGALTYPVGMITADEIIYAGADGNFSSNTSFYLYNNYYSWALSPIVFDGAVAYGFVLTSDGNLSDDYVVTGYGLRPVVSLRPGTTISGGIGTPSSPYIVGEYNGGSSSGGGSEPN